MRAALVFVQATTFFALGLLLAAEGQHRLGFAQVLLGVVTVAVYL